MRFVPVHGGLRFDLSVALTVGVRVLSRGQPQMSLAFQLQQQGARHHALEIIFRVMPVPGAQSSWLRRVRVQPGFDTRRPRPQSRFSSVICRPCMPPTLAMPQSCVNRTHESRPNNNDHENVISAFDVALLHLNMFSTSFSKLEFENRFSGYSSTEKRKGFVKAGVKWTSVVQLSFRLT